MKAPCRNAGREAGVPTSRTALGESGNVAQLIAAWIASSERLKHLHQCTIMTAQRRDVATSQREIPSDGNTGLKVPP